jgi:site-specific DNA recombinase
MPVLGYDLGSKGGGLIVNEEEAARVQAIYRLYLERKALIPVVRELEHRQWQTKQWTTRRGRERGGKLFTKGSLFRLLTNIIYTGKINYKGTIYAGEHCQIVDTEVWQRVQDVLRHNGRTGGKKVHDKHGALLKGLLYCSPCEAGMVHSYTLNNKKRYRYYVCINAQQRGWTSCPTKSLNAHEIETAVVDYIRGIGKKREITVETAADERDFMKALSVLDPVWDSLASREQSRIIRLLLKRVSYDGQDGKVRVTFHSQGIKALYMELSSVDRRKSNEKNVAQS